MATTTNYGWATPDDTALVKDGASAIRTLGSSVDTTTKNLNPETTLGDLSFRSSTSNVNTRIPIGSSGQHLTVVAGVPAWSTASDQTPLTTKGDLLTFDTADARLGVGANGTTLVADSSEATGLKWQAPAGGGFVGCKATKTADQTLSNNTPTMLTWNDEDFDTNAFHDNSTNNTRITIPAGKAGYYLVTSYMGMFPAGSPSGNFYLAFYINGVQQRLNTNHMGTDNSAQVVEIYNLAVNDYLEAEGYQNSGGSGTVRGGAANESSFAVQYLGA